MLRPWDFGLKASEAGLTLLDSAAAGLPALWGGEPGQGRKAAATATYRKCRGSGSPPLPFLAALRMSGFLVARQGIVALLKSSP